MAKWGRPSACGGCGTCDRCKRAAYMRDWYAKRSFEQRSELRTGRDMDAVRARDRARHERMREDPAYIERRRATTALNNAIRDGRIDRGVCEVCGNPDAHGHHDDYDLPLEVRWLCTKHHAEHHTTVAD